MFITMITAQEFVNPETRWDPKSRVPMTDNQYLSKQSRCCPNCGSINIKSTEHATFDDVFNVVCLNCLALYLDCGEEGYHSLQVPEVATADDFTVYRDVPKPG